MGVKHNKGDFVWLKIGARSPIKIMVIEALEDNFYLLDWVPCGFNVLLNTVKIPGTSLLTES